MTNPVQKTEIKINYMENVGCWRILSLTINGFILTLVVLRNIPK